MEKPTQSLDKKLLLEQTEQGLKVSFKDREGNVHSIEKHMIEGLPKLDRVPREFFEVSRARLVATEEVSKVYFTGSLKGGFFPEFGATLYAVLTSTEVSEGAKAIAKKAWNYFFPNTEPTKEKEEEIKNKTSELNNKFEELSKEDERSPELLKGMYMMHEDFLILQDLGKDPIEKKQQRDLKSKLENLTEDMNDFLNNFASTLVLLHKKEPTIKEEEKIERNKKDSEGFSVSLKNSMKCQATGILNGDLTNISQDVFHDKVMFGEHVTDYSTNTKLAIEKLEALRFEKKEIKNEIEKSYNVSYANCKNFVGKIGKMDVRGKENIGINYGSNSR